MPQRHTSDAQRTPPQVKLRHLVPSDRAAIRRWMRDPAVVDYTVLVPGPECVAVDGYSEATADLYFRSLLFDHTRRAFAVIYRGVHVGNVGLRELDQTKGTTECFVELGECMARGHGVGLEAMRLVIDYAFFELDIETMRLGVFEFNDAAIRMYTRLGFKSSPPYGWHWRDERYWRVLGMSLAREDWPASTSSLAH